MKRTSHTAIYFLISLVAFAGLAGLYWTVYKSIDGQTVRTANVLKEVVKEKYRKDHEKNLAGTLKGVEADRSRIMSFFIRNDQAVGFIEKIESIGGAAGTNVTISSINADDLSEKPEGTIGKFGAHISTVGTWPSVMKSILLAEQLPYSVSINNLRFETASLEDAAGKALPEKGWKADFDIEVLSIK